MPDLLEKELNLSGRDLYQVMQSVLDKNASFRFTAKGFSMSPFIRDQDIITIFPVPFRGPDVGDVVVVKNKISGSAVVHRVIKEIKANYLIKGDNCQEFDGLFSGNQIAGIITKVERDGKQIWFGKGPGKTLIALVSRTGALNKIILPVLRKIKNWIHRLLRL